ncbi:hypothetical protein Q2T46_11735 [Thermoanaerobacterium sp. CMT5567-10]|uniref:hypothetical protein n=1 Tax=Thermoanaerobacterium sp. CMT5567-10 TaxID=3061989 RepID=UPI0026E0DAF4|nr:hypothetical protein [Thermoanaerobacterium sp. CMT5567-10]WKV08198.1 hypothetical protein Q2T46_11735 [Thermoanaerobacterium sp. CMT5567-10]
MAQEKYTEPVYNIQDILENSKALFKCNREVVKGAIYGIDKKEFTVKEVQDLIQKFLKRGVK